MIHYLKMYVQQENVIKTYNRNVFTMEITGLNPYGGMFKETK